MSYEAKAEDDNSEEEVFTGPEIKENRHKEHGGKGRQGSDLKKQEQERPGPEHNHSHSPIQGKNHSKGRGDPLSSFEL